MIEDEERERDEGMQEERRPREEIGPREEMAAVPVVETLATVAGVIDMGAKIMNGVVELGRAADNLGRFWSETLHGVTNIKAWGNATGETVEVFKFDGGTTKRDRRTILPNTSVTGGADMWIPWTDWPVHYKTHHATIVVGGREVAYFWQSGDSIRFNVENAFVANGPAIPGAAQAGGERTMVVAKDNEGNLGIVLGVFKR